MARNVALLTMLFLAAAVAATAAAASPTECAPPPEEVQALREFYHSQGGPQWRQNDNWLEGNPCGSSADNSNNWIGIICGRCRDGVRHVEVIALEWNKLTGNLTATVGRLVHLQVLNLGTNELRGPLPPELGSIKGLRVLKLSYNRFTGKLPAEVYALSKLELLDLAYNEVIADLNQMLAGYPLMKKLILRGNRGVAGDLGQANDSIAKMRNLLILDIHWNSVGGKLPRALFHLPRLEELYMSNNDIAGSIPDDANLPQIIDMHLSDNYIEGTLPESLFAHAALLENFDASRNLITGSVPASVGVPKKLKTLVINNNLLTGSLPREIWTLPKLEVLNAANNDLSGELGAEVAGLESLHDLILHSGRLTGRMPEALGKLSKLRVLDLGNNKLSGEIPNSLGGLSFLRRLSLRTNRLSGAVPASLGDCAALETLELQSNRLESLPESLSKLAALRELYAHLNLFSQPVPAWLGRITTLEALTLHGNRFTGERIPDEFGELRALREFTLHDNVIKGNPYPRVDPGIDDNPPHDSLPFCEDLRDYESGKLAKRYFRTCGTRNDFYVDVLRLESREQWVETHGEMWHACYGKCKKSDDYHKHLDFQRSSRYADMFEVADKARFAAFVKRMQRIKGDEFHMHPPTFRLPYELEEYKEEYKRDPSGYWLLKPTISCCGQNIRLVTGPDDPSFPLDLGNWILQRFIHPPMLVNNHKYVLRLFVMVTSFSPLRAYLHPDGDVFYTHAEYRVKLDDINKLNKRGYFITDYFFSTKQRELFTSSTHLFDYLKSTGVDTDAIFRSVRDVIVKALMVAEPVFRQQERERIAHPQSVYEVVGYDILIDANHKPWVCEVNTTPNMGLEINKAGDPVIHEEDFELKLRIMRNFLQVVGVVDLPDGHPNQANARTEACEGIVDRKLAELGRRVNESAYCPDSELDFVCLSEDDVAILKEYECEYQRRDELEPMFPGEEADKYLRLFERPRREQHLVVWWDRVAHTAPDPKAPTPWARHYERPWRNMPANYNWNAHKMTPNTPGNRWNTEEEGRMPDPEHRHVSILNDLDAFEEDGSARAPADAAPAEDAIDPNDMARLRDELGGDDAAAMPGAYGDVHGELPDWMLEDGGGAAGEELDEEGENEEEDQKEVDNEGDEEEDEEEEEEKRQASMAKKKKKKKKKKSKKPGAASSKSKKEKGATKKKKRKAAGKKADPDGAGEGKRKKKKKKSSKGQGKKGRPSQRPGDSGPDDMTPEQRALLDEEPQVVMFTEDEFDEAEWQKDPDGYMARQMARKGVNGIPAATFKGVEELLNKKIAQGGPAGAPVGGAPSGQAAGAAAGADSGAAPKKKVVKKRAPSPGRDEL